jgi:hypothetical protein
MADPARFELTTSAFGGQRSIQLSYGSGAQNIPEGPRRCNAGHHVIGPSYAACRKGRLSTADGSDRWWKRANERSSSALIVLVALVVLEGGGASWLMLIHGAPRMSSTWRRQPGTADA